VVSTVVKRGAAIGANATIICGVTIGEGAMVGAGSTVTHDVPAKSLLVGNPGRVIGPWPRVAARR
jgi:UDP-2-acetamido-3-amino-2,3-dideoxy-glucuronate N-acetyltransferase